jgi:hypothetical protein
LLSVPICWRSKSQKGVTLSRTEAKSQIYSSLVE